MDKNIEVEVKKLIDDDTIVCCDTTPLVTSGLLTSVKIVELCAWLEDKYKIDFSTQPFNIYNFETIESIDRFILQYRK